MRDAYKRERIHTAGNFVCRKDFKCSGRSYSRDQVFDWRKMSLSERRVLQLWDGRFIAPEETIADEAKDREVKAERRQKEDTAIYESRKRAQNPEADVKADKEEAVEAEVAEVTEPSDEDKEDMKADKPKRGRPKKFYDI